MPLTASDPHHWAPIPAVVDWLTNRLSPEAKVLEIGPGHAPFPRANAFVEFDLARSHNFPGAVQADAACERLPFEDKSFDFVYCRHVLEDSWNPFHICKEMERVAKAGYIETPSPIAELCRGVDGGAPPYRGYHHHRWVVWSSPNTLHFMSKYPLIEYLDIDESRLVPLLRHPQYWNTYFLWDTVVGLRHWQSPLDYDIPRDYRPHLARAVSVSIESTVSFFAKFEAKAA